MRTERSTRVSALSLKESSDVFEARMPAGHNRWFVIAAAVFGFPWLVGYAALSIVIVTGASDGWRGFLTWVLLTLLTILIDVVAVAAIWAAGYALRGQETLVADRAQVTLRRRALGVTIPFHAKRGVMDRVAPLTASVPGPAAPRPQLELRGASARLRFGAGLTPDEATMLADALSGFLARTRGAAADG